MFELSLVKFIISFIKCENILPLISSLVVASQFILHLFLQFLYDSRMGNNKTLRQILEGSSLFLSKGGRNTELHTAYGSFNTKFFIHY